jgi:hypothetical protein
VYIARVLIAADLLPEKASLTDLSNPSSNTKILTFGRPISYSPNMISEAPMREKITNALSTLLKPIVHFSENRGYITPALIATCDYSEEWEDDEGDHQETITFYLMEYPSGRRDWRVYEYGQCADEGTHTAYLRDILVWTYGGPLPRNAKKIGATILEVINIEPAEQPPAA